MIINPIYTPRFLMRNLTALDDLTNYLSWMRSIDTLPYIESAKADYKTEELISYLNIINSSKTDLQLSIFEKSNQRHIGNIKFHEINFAFRSCIVGFLIGEPLWQNKGVAGEVFDFASKQLLELFGISLYKLGVDPSNIQAIRAYTKMGFVLSYSFNIDLENHRKLLMAQVISS